MKSRTIPLLSSTTSTLRILIFVLGAAPLLSAVASSEPRTYYQIAEGREAGSGVVESFEALTTSVSPLQSLSTSTPTSPLSAASASAPVAQALTNGEALGEQRTLVSLVNFTNDPSTPYLAADIDFAILDDTNPASTASYVLEASYGRAYLSGSVGDWFSASYANDNCHVATQSGTQDLIDEMDALIDFSTIDRWIIVIPGTLTCGFAGISSLGKWDFVSDEGPVQFSRIVINATSLPSSTLVSHELGHSLAGLQHSKSLECGALSVGPTCTYLQSDTYDVMGSSTFGGHFTPHNKQALQWFSGDLVDVTGTGGTFLIEPYETTGPGIKAIRIPAARTLDDYSDVEYYYVTYRKPVGFDAIFSTLNTDGAMLHQDSNYFNRPHATGPSGLIDGSPDAPASLGDAYEALLEVGQTFSDPDLGITIETLGVVSGALEVEVTRTQYCGNGVQDVAFSETCDGSQLGGATCESIGRTSGTLGCTAACEFDVSGCGAAVCESGHDFDLATGLCSLSVISTGETDMNVYRNAADLGTARAITIATLLTSARGSIGTFQNTGTSPRTIVSRLLMPFDTSSLPDGVVIDSATLDLKHDVLWDPLENTRPDLGDQLVLVQTDDPEPLVRTREDFGRFSPLDLPDEGAPRIDAGDEVSVGDRFAFELNSTGIGWVSDTGLTLLGLRTGYDVDDVQVATEEVRFRLPIVPNDSRTAAPRLTVRYAPVPEPSVAPGLGAGLGLIALWSRRRRLRTSTRAIPSPGSTALR